MFTMPVSSVDSGRSNDNYGNWNNPFVYLVWMWAFSMFGGNGLWGNRNGVGTVETQAITASQVDDIRAQVAAIRQGIECGDANIMRAVDQLADTARANQIKIDGGFTAVNQNIQQTGTQIANGISNLGFTIQQQFCNTNSLIEANTRAVQAEGAMTRQLLVDQVKDAEISRLRGIVAENSQQRQTTELFAAQQAQTATLLPLLQQIINNTTKTTSSTATA